MIRDGDGDLSEQEFVDGAVDQVSEIHRLISKIEKQLKRSYLNHRSPCQVELRDRLGKIVRSEDAPLYRMSSCYWPLTNQMSTVYCMTSFFDRYLLLSTPFLVAIENKPIYLLSYLCLIFSSSAFFSFYQSDVQLKSTGRGRGDPDFRDGEGKCRNCLFL